MCGRFVDPNLRSEGLDTSWLKIDPIPRRFNVKPTQDILIAAKSPLEGMIARWGLVPSWHKGSLQDWKATTFNARLEEARDKPTFRAVWRFGRCLVPAAGYFEWVGDKAPKQPHFIASGSNEETLWFAGLASRWNGLLTCTIMTRPANDQVAALHPRMPVCLDLAEREAWLAGSDDTGLGAGARLRHHPVARFGLADDGPGLLDLIEDDHPH